MEQVVLETVQWSALEDIEDVEPISNKDYQVLAELRAVLAKHNYFNRFGVCLLHRHFELAPDEILMENTDTSARVSTLHVQKNDVAGKSIETMWRFSSSRTEVTVCEQKCHYQDGHRTVHVKVGR